MSKSVQLKHKAKAAIVLIVIIVLLLLNNFLGRQNYLSLDKSISSIYQDRLMPATYIYEISDHLYQKRLLQQENAVGQSTLSDQQVHDKAITGLIHNYEQTFLTSEEKDQWAIFKQQLIAYNALPDGTNQTAHESFTDVMQSLHSLSQLQVGEGTLLQKDAKAVISGSNLMSVFEFSVLVVLGLTAIVLISTPDKVLAKPDHYSLN